MAIVGELVAVNHAYGKIVGLRMLDEQPANGGRGLYGVVLGESDIESLPGIQTVEHNTLE